MAGTPGVDVVIVAAGGSRRMGGIDKLEASIHGRPLLSWTVERMRPTRGLGRLVLVAAPRQLERLRSAAWLEGSGAIVVAGGASRSESVHAGVQASSAPIVLVHDGARPLASASLADSVAAAAAQHGAAVPVVAVVDSLKRVAHERLVDTVERGELVRAQTPQAAGRELLLDAFGATAGQTFSDGAAMLQSRGVPVATVPGEPFNLKVTEPADLELVRALLSAQPAGGETRSGSGHDSHPFGPEDGLLLGGLLIEAAPRLYGHSDGDVALHALSTALLAAAGLGDLGRHFPAGRPETKGIASGELLAATLRFVADSSWRPSTAQLTLLAARPRLGFALLENMRGRMAELLGISVEAFALSASSGNLNGPEGAGLAISASASVTLVRR